MNSLIKNYFLLTKPRVLTLLIFSSFGGAFLAKQGVPNLAESFGLFIGGYCSSGAAATLNMYFETDIDKDMGRTRNRPIAEGTISHKQALVFAIALAILSFTSLYLLNNLLAAILAFAGGFFYVGIYTLYLKRRTIQNIVIGGSAGAFPPLVGYAAISNNITLEALYLFLIIFFWTPPHFWALAIMIKDDYERAKIPMLPVVKGIKNASLQIFLYCILLMFISLLIVTIASSLGWIYVTSSIVLGAILIAKSYKLLKQLDRPSAVSTYKFSLLYLFLLIGAVMIDSSVIFMEL
ncbi:MAG: protoheme IX farnesyltransferase [Chloroflexi bacterium]|nr:protoheme IX farnesyltransferase [Chloroflexota bacterium]|tara:strand:- start:1044 stop:1922 length:879 start_codon:yes stop_codon:yes gene_type:complete